MAARRIAVALPVLALGGLVACGRGGDGWAQGWVTTRTAQCVDALVSAGESSDAASAWCTCVVQARQQRFSEREDREVYPLGPFRGHIDVLRADCRQFETPYVRAAVAEGRTAPATSN